MLYTEIQHKTERKDTKTNTVEMDTFKIYLLTADEMKKRPITSADLESYFLVKHPDGFKLTYVYGKADRVIRLEIALGQDSHLGKTKGFQDGLEVFKDQKKWNKDNLNTLGECIFNHRNSPADNKVLDDRFKFTGGKTGGANGAGEYGAFYAERANPNNQQFFKQDPDYDKVYCEAVISQLIFGLADKDKQHLMAEVDLAVTQQNTGLPESGKNVYLRSKLFKGYCDLWEDAYFALKYFPHYEEQLTNTASNNKKPKGRAKFYQDSANTNIMIENGRYTEGLIEGIVNADFFDDPDLHEENFGTVRKARTIKISKNSQEKEVRLISEEVIEEQGGKQLIQAKDNEGNIYTFFLEETIDVENTKQETNNKSVYEITLQNLTETISNIRCNNSNIKIEGTNKTFETQRLHITETINGRKKDPKYIYKDVDTVRIDAGGGGGDNRSALFGEGRKYDDKLHFINPGLTTTEKYLHELANLTRYRFSKEGPPPYFAKFPKRFIEGGEIYLNYLKKSLLPENEINTLFENVFQNCNDYYGKDNLENAAKRLGVKLNSQDDEVAIKRKIKDHMLTNFKNRQAYGKKTSITLLINQNIQAIKNNDAGIKHTNDNAIALLQKDYSQSSEINLFLLLNTINELELVINRRNNKKENDELTEFRIGLCEKLLNAYRKNPNTIDLVIRDIHSKINKWNGHEVSENSIKYLSNENLLSRINKLGNDYDINKSAKEKLAQIKKTLQAKLKKAYFLADQEFELEMEQIANIVHDYENNILPCYKQAMDSMKDCSVKVVLEKPNQAEYDLHTWYLVNPNPSQDDKWELFRPVNKQKNIILEKVALSESILKLLSKKEISDDPSVANQPGEDATQPLLSKVSSESAIVYDPNSKEYKPTQPLITEINAFRNNLLDVKREQEDSINHFMAQASWYSNRHALLNPNEDWKVAVCAGIGALLGIVLGAAAGLAVGAAAGGVLGNVVGAVAGGSVAGVIAAVKGAGIGAAIGTAIAFTVFGGIGAGVGAFFAYKGSERYQLSKNNRQELKEKNIEMQESVGEEARSKLSPAKPG